jgi:hypothetical protein
MSANSARELSWLFQEAQQDPAWLAEMAPLIDEDWMDEAHRYIANEIMPASEADDRLRHPLILLRSGQSYLPVREMQPLLSAVLWYAPPSSFSLSLSATTREASLRLLLTAGQHSVGRLNLGCHLPNEACIEAVRRLRNLRRLEIRPTAEPALRAINPAWPLTQLKVTFPTNALEVTAARVRLPPTLAHLTLYTAGGLLSGLADVLAASRVTLTSLRIQYASPEYNHDETADAEVLATVLALPGLRHLKLFHLYVATVTRSLLEAVAGLADLTDLRLVDCYAPHGDGESVMASMKSLGGRLTSLASLEIRNDDEIETDQLVALLSGLAGSTSLQSLGVYLTANAIQFEGVPEALVGVLARAPLRDLTLFCVGIGNSAAHKLASALPRVAHSLASLQLGTLMDCSAETQRLLGDGIARCSLLRRVNFAGGFGAPFFKTYVPRSPRLEALTVNSVRDYAELQELVQAEVGRRGREAMLTRGWLLVLAGILDSQQKAFERRVPHQTSRMARLPAGVLHRLAAFMVPTEALPLRIT